MMLNNILYMYSNMDNSSQILLFLIILVALMLISIFVINIITKKRNDKYDKQFNPIDRYTKTIEKHNKTKNKKIEKPEIKKEKIIKLETNDKNEIKPEINKKNNIKPEVEDVEVIDDSEVIEVISEDSSVDKISMLLEDNINNPKPIDLTEFEREEEKNAIISYDELVRKAGAKKIIYKTEKATINEELKEEKIEIKEDGKSKFKASKVISPIYGVKKETKPKEELEEFIDLENVEPPKRRYMDEDLQKDITFLTSLKTFRSNLD